MELQNKCVNTLRLLSVDMVQNANSGHPGMALGCAPIIHILFSKKVETGDFRADLFFRINVLPIHEPTLAERREDIPELIFELLKNVEIDAQDRPKFNSEAISALAKHNWPGNVRELKNLIERACILFPGKEVTNTNVFENLLRLKA